MKYATLIAALLLSMQVTAEPWQDSSQVASEAPLRIALGKASLKALGAL